jgi:hypothetical protein
MNARLLCALCAVLLLAGGCVAIGPDAREAAETDAIVAGTMAAARLPAEARQRELARAQEAFAQRADDRSTLRLAALLATLPPPQRDDARAAALLAPLAARLAESPHTRLAQLLAAQVAERQRLAAERQRMAAEQQRIVRSGARREGELKNQIEALKAIERSVLDREQRLHTQAR